MVDDLLERPELLEHASADGLLRIVRTTDQLRTVDVAHARHPRWVRAQVVDVAAGAADHAVGEARNEVLGRDVDEEGAVDTASDLGERRVEGGRLGTRARKAVEDRASRSVRAAEPIEEQANHGLVRNELTRAHDRVDLAPGLAAGRDLRAKELAGSEHRHAEPLRQQWRLSALAGARCAKEHSNGHRRSFPR